MIEVFKLSRSYKELIERLELEKIDDVKYLPVVVGVDDYFDDTTVDDEHLPCIVMDIVDEDDDITYLMLTKNTKRDWTKITNVDGFYELIGGNNVVKYYADIINGNGHYNNHYNVMRVSKDENCYVKVRLIYDDGG